MNTKPFVTSDDKLTFKNRIMCRYIFSGNYAWPSRHQVPRFLKEIGMSIHIRKSKVLITISL